jgi:hypothetical protein
MQMDGYIAGPFEVVLGTHQFSGEIYVAPIEEEMLLGLDFLEANGVSLHLCNVRGINISPLVAAFTIYFPARDSLSCAPTLMTKLGGTLHPSPIRKEVAINTAGKGMQMDGYIAGPFEVVLGTHQFSGEIYVAPIEEEMLLGLDFLEANGVANTSPFSNSTW